MATQSVSETVLYVSIALTGTFGVLSAIVTGFFQRSDKKIDREFQRKSILRDKVEGLFEALEFAHANAHDASIAAIKNLADLNNSPTMPVVRPYEIGNIRALCAYFPETK